MLRRENKIVRVWICVMVAIGLAAHLHRFSDQA